MNFKQWLQEGTKFIDKIHDDPCSDADCITDKYYRALFTSKSEPYEGQEVEVEIELIGDDWLPLTLSPSNKVKTTFVYLKGKWYNKDVVSFTARRSCTIKNVKVLGFPEQKDWSIGILTGGKVYLWKEDKVVFDIANLTFTD